MSICEIISIRWYGWDTEIQNEREKRANTENGRKRKRYKEKVYKRTNPIGTSPEKHKHTHTSNLHKILSLKASSTIEYTENCIQHSKAWLFFC